LVRSSGGLGRRSGFRGGRPPGGGRRRASPRPSAHVKGGNRRRHDGPRRASPPRRSRRARGRTASRGKPRTSRRRSFRQTSAARSRSPREMPCAMDPSVPDEHGRTGHPAPVGDERAPDEIGASNGTLAVEKRPFARVPLREARGGDVVAVGADPRADLVGAPRSGPRRSRRRGGGRRPGTPKRAAAPGARAGTRSRPRLRGSTLRSAHDSTLLSGRRVVSHSRRAAGGDRFFCHLHPDGESGQKAARAAPPRILRMVTEAPDSQPRPVGPA